MAREASGVGCVVIELLRMREQKEPGMGKGSTEAPKRSLLGVLVPDDGPIDYEWFSLETWLAEHGVGDVGVLIERPPAEGDHVFDDLMRIGEIENLLPGTRRLATAGADVVLWACTSGSFIGGPEWSRSQVEALSRAVDRPATSTTRAFIEAARAIGAVKVDVLGTYPQPVTNVFAGCLREAGVEVADVAALEIQNGLGSFQVDLPGEVTRFAARDPNSQRPILIPDTAVNSLDLVDRLEDLAGRPVVTANQASVWHALRLSKQSSRLPKAGSLFLQE